MLFPNTQQLQFYVHKDMLYKGLNCFVLFSESILIDSDQYIKNKQTSLKPAA